MAPIRANENCCSNRPNRPAMPFLAAYPEGTYDFNKDSQLTDVWFSAAALLSHDLPPQAVILSPQDEASNRARPLC